MELNLFLTNITEPATMGIIKFIAHMQIPAKAILTIEVENTPITNTA